MIGSPKDKILYPNKQDTRPLNFLGKPTIIIGSRVHCGETPASFILQGIYEFLMWHQAPTLNEENKSSDNLG